jgi:rhamnogalacturonan acetylesterase
MQTYAATSDIQGWGKPLEKMLSLKVVNRALGGRSARSFTREGRFDEVGRDLKAGDYVIIEFGHNDGGSLSNDNGRTDCSPQGTDYDTKCQVVYQGKNETVLTYMAYIRNAANAYIQKGASVIVSTATPNDPWESGRFSYSSSRFVTYAWAAANATKSVLVDHGQSTADAFQVAGAAAMKGYFRSGDHTHTTPAGAEVVARAFITALRATNSTLKTYIV